MRKSVLLLVFLLNVIVFKTNAQASLTPYPLPYSTGFDSAISNSSPYSWAQFNDNDANTSAYKWAIVTSASAPSAPNILQSPNAALTNTALTDTISRWYVSPPLALHQGDTIKSFSINVFAANCAAISSDSILLYLILGSDVPTVSYGNILLANLTNMATCDNVFRDTGNFVIPYTPFPFSCIAFKYYSVHDSFQVSIDNINISSGQPTAVKSVVAQDMVSIYPNPATSKVQVVLGNKPARKGIVTLYNVLGQSVLNADFESLSQPLSIDLSSISPGAYYAEIVTDTKDRYVKQLTVSR